MSPSSIRRAVEVDPTQFLSKGRNSPYTGMTSAGAPLYYCSRVSRLIDRGILPPTGDRETTRGEATMLRKSQSRWTH